MVSFKLPTGVLQKAFIHSFYEKMTTLRSNHNNEYCYLVFQHRLFGNRRENKLENLTD